MTGRSEKSYTERLKQLDGLDLDRCRAHLGIMADDQGLAIPFYNRRYRLNQNYTAIVDDRGRHPSEAVGRVLVQYLLRCPPAPVAEGPMVTFRELANAGPLVSSFAGNTQKIITSAFAADLSALIARSASLEGQMEAGAERYDLSVQFQALPRISLYLRFNAAEGPFPAQCTLLFHQSTQVYLDMTSIFILGTYLTGQLIGK